MSIHSHELDAPLRATIAQVRAEVCTPHALLPRNGLVAWTSGDGSVSNRATTQHARIPGRACAPGAAGAGATR